MSQRVLDHGEVAQAEEVHLQQAERLDTVHVELRHDLLRVVARVLGELEREVVHERGVADHHPGRVHGVLSTEPLERPGGLDDLLRLWLALVRVREVGRELQRVLDRIVAAHDGGRVHLAETVAHDRREPEHAGGVADALLALDRLERDDLRDVVGPVLLGRVADHLVATALVEVHVDVGHLDALGVQEAFEQQAVAQRIEVGDAQGVAHDRAGRRASARPNADALLASVPDQVPDDQEVAAESHARDHAELVVDALADLGRDLAVALCGSLVDELAKVRVAIDAARRLEPRQVVSLLGGRPVSVHEVELDALGDVERVVADLGRLGEDLAHLLGALEEELVGVELQPLQVGLHLLLLDAEQHVVRLGVFLEGVVQIVRGHDRDGEITAEFELLTKDAALVARCRGPAPR